MRQTTRAEWLRPGRLKWGRTHSLFVTLRKSGALSVKARKILYFACRPAEKVCLRYVALSDRVWRVATLNRDDEMGS